jgi:site-specific DNA-methyltransferase (adenine-specific)
MDYMRELPSNAFELAIVDPPYGIKINMNQGRRRRQVKRHAPKAWDSCPPSLTYFAELFRISCFAIIWGANNFGLPPSNGWIVWDKGITGDVGFSKAELAYTNCANTVNLFKCPTQTGPEVYCHKIHPTQKPVAFYKWLLENYAKEDDKILDTHLGSGSSRIAAYDMGFDFVGIELDKDYFEAQEKRFADHIAQPSIFEPDKKVETQEAMF